MYSSALGQSPLIDDLIGRLRDKVKMEIAFQKDLMQTLASMDMLFARSAVGDNRTMAMENATTPVSV